MANVTMIRWNGGDYLEAFQKEADKRLARAAIHLSRQIKQNLSIAVAREKLKQKFKKSKSKRKIKGKQGVRIIRSIPGEFPRKEFGELRRSITYVVIPGKHIARVGTNKLYGKYLELGTKHMKPRPFLERTLRDNQSKIAGILAGKKIVIKVT